MVFEHKTIQNLEDYFTDLSKRREKAVYFYRINGTSSHILDFLYRYYEAARHAGVIIEGKIPNPTEDNLSYYNEIMGMDFRMEPDFIDISLKKWLPRMSDNGRSNVAGSIFRSLERMRKQGKTDNMLKNAYIKFMCWLYYKFERIVNLLGQEKVPKILYEGSISNYELLLISILSDAGCDVVLLQKKGDGDYLKVDGASVSSIEYIENGTTAFAPDFSMKKYYSDRMNAELRKVSNNQPQSEPVRPVNQTTGRPMHINIARPTVNADNSSTAKDSVSGETSQGIKLNINISGGSADTGKKTKANSSIKHIPEQDVYRCTNAWIEGKGLSDILQPVALRGDDENLFYNVFCRINGVEDRNSYANELFMFYQALKNAKRQVVIVNNSIPKPTSDEIAGIHRNNYIRIEQLIADLRSNIQYAANLELRDIMVKAFEHVIKEEASEGEVNISRLTNKAVYLLCWLKRYQQGLFKNWSNPEVGCFIYFGGCKDKNEAMFMRFLSRIPVDVLILCPDLNFRCRLSDSCLYEKNNPNTLSLDAFPEQGAGMHIGTAAYHAERDLDSTMYSDSGMYRNQQFGKANIISLNTMDREIKLIWESELKYRPNFSTNSGGVNLPVIFSKISGVKDKRKIEDYWISIKQYITPETVLIDRPPFFDRNSSNPIKIYASEFFKNGKLQRNKITGHQCYQYGFLRTEMQEHIMDKLELLIEQRLIKGTFENGTEYTIISVVLNMPKEVMRLIQKFDFTKSNPKLIYVNTTENLMTIEDSIYIAFLNLIGFDVLFFIPTGYNIENYYTKRIMEEHQIGEFVYDLQIPDWNIVPAKSKGWRSKVFKK